MSHGYATQGEVLVTRREIETFLVLDSQGPGYHHLPERQMMRGSAFKAIYYILATFMFLLYGAIL